MRANLPLLSVVLAASAGPAFAGAMFSALPAESGAALGVMIVGIVIFLFTAVLSVGALVGGTMQAIRRWREDHQDADHPRARAG